ncbi:hypothetical protein ABI59_21405 [Acidobacteria bacterium Mor1]|nr:hypothetical protein ABI59_21405 [Acidobacteria bacterium Mor1]
MRRPIGNGAIEVLQGDITALEVDALVNAANSALHLGAGVAGAIRIAGGPSIQRECDEIGHCAVGSAVATGAGNLPAGRVIHAVGPVWGQQSEEESDRLLALACGAALGLAEELELRSVAIPAISAGTFGFPVERAADILLGQARDHLSAHQRPERVLFCLFDGETREMFEKVLAELEA